jgi:hypothetical protein
MMVATELANLLLERAGSSAQLRPAQLSSPSHATLQPTIDYVCARARHFPAPPLCAGAPSPPPRPLARPLVFSLVCHLVSLRTQRSGRCSRFGRVLPQIDTKRVVKIALCVAPPPPSRPRARRTRTERLARRQLGFRPREQQTRLVSARLGCVSCRRARFGRLFAPNRHVMSG